MVDRQRFEISFIYEVSVDEEKLFHRHSRITDEMKLHAKQLLHAVLRQEEVADYLMVYEIAFDLADIGGHERMPEVLTGYEIDDHTPLEAVLDHVPEEVREEYSDGDEIEQALEGALEVTLDHVHVRRLQEHEHQPDS